ncbi:DUF2274 domain-containing protein [Hellea balneolensis]|uniref:DUF2274 domain-containing protein n=1 Tax=Hellea balneolensis TaxID=287478 RepID=UPI00040E3688|nr:DUF2274 domain-containing protein [Hellea balneolensis]
MADAKPKLKLPKLQQHKPVKVPVTLPYDVNQDLEAYAAIYENTYGEKQPVNALIPSMLASFLASDTGFKKAKRELA